MFSMVRLMFWYVPFMSVALSLNYVDNYGFILKDEATGITHHLVPGDFAFFHVGTKVKVCHNLRFPYLTRSEQLPDIALFSFSSRPSLRALPSTPLLDPFELRTPT